MLQQSVRKLCDREDEHEIEEQLDEGDAVVLMALPRPQMIAARGEHAHRAAKLLGIERLRDSRYVRQPKSSPPNSSPVRAARPAPPMTPGIAWDRPAAAMTGRRMSSLEQLGALVAGYRPDPAARAAVRLHVADTIGAWIAATGTAEGRALLAFREPGAGLLDRWRSIARWRA